MLGRGAVGWSGCRCVCLWQAVQTLGAAAVWSGQPAASEEAQSEERAGDPGDARVGGRTKRKDAPRRGLESRPAPSSQVRREQRLLCPHRDAGIVAASTAAARESGNAGALQQTGDPEGDTFFTPGV